MKVIILGLVLAIGVGIVFAESNIHENEDLLESQDQLPEVQETPDQALKSRRPRCPRDNSIELYIPDVTCNRFWQCSNGVPIRMTCPRGLNWNRRLNVCDWPWRARCNGRRFASEQLDAEDQGSFVNQIQAQEHLSLGEEAPQEDSVQPLERLRPRCPRNNSRRVYIPDVNCNRFWQCSNGVAIRMSCPKGLNWNRRLNVCDWPERARCSRRG